MKKQLTDELIIALQRYIPESDREDAAMSIALTLDGYSITEEETSLVVYEEDATQLVFKKFLAAKIAKGCSARTIGFYRDSIRKSLMAINKPYDQITADDIRYYLAMRVQKDGVTKTTANNERRALSSFYQWLQTEEILLKNPMNKVDAIKVTKKKKKAFSKMEIEHLRDACRTNRERALVETLLSTWARVSEIALIRIDEISGDRIVVHGKGDKEREVYLTPKAQLMIEKYLREREDSNPFLFPRAKYAGNAAAFTKDRGRRRSPEWYQCKDLVDDEGHMDACSIEGVVRKIGKRAGVDNTHPHRFRRTGATMALRSGMPLLQVSKLLGHEQISTTQIYLDISDEELMEAHNKYAI